MKPRPSPVSFSPSLKQESGSVIAISTSKIDNRKSSLENVALFGKDPLPRIVDVQPLLRGEYAEQAGARIYRRTEDDNVTVTDEPFYPFFFVSDPQMLRGLPRERFRLQQFDGDNFFRYVVAFQNWGDYWDGVRRVERHSETQGGRPEELYRIGSPVQQYLMQSGRSCFLDMHLADLHRMQLDIEVRSDEEFPNAERPADEVIIVALSDNRGWECVLHQRDQSEGDLLEQLVGTIREHDPDVIEGHNIFKFDLDYLRTRCNLRDVPFAVGRDGSEPRAFSSSMRFAERTVDFPAVKIAGRHVIDTYFQVMAFDVFKRDLPGYGLKESARYFGFAPEGRTYVEGGDITRLWQEDPERLLEYATDDVRETERLARHLSGSDFYLSQMVPMPYGQAARTGPASKIEALFVREYLRQKQSFPRSAWGSQSTGGYTDIFVTGVLGPIAYADVESLYPSIMLNYDVQPEGDTLALFPRLLERLTELRFETKRAMKSAATDEERGELDARQSSYKILINCFDPETEIITVDGVKNIADVEVGDLVYSLNPETLEAEIKPVTDTKSQHYEGPMVEIKTSHIDYLVTPNHRFFTSKHTSGEHQPYTWETAKEMFQDRIRRRLPPLCSLPSADDSDQFSLAVKCDELGMEYKTGPRGIKEPRRQARWQPEAYDMDDWLALVGWFVSEGTLYKSKKKEYANGNVRGVSYRITICRKKKEERSTITELLDRMGISYHAASVNGISFCSKIIYKVLERECGNGSHDRRLPEWIFSLPKYRLAHLFEALMQGDGHANGERYTTASDTLARQFVRLAKHLGRRAYPLCNDGWHRIKVKAVRGQSPTFKPRHRRKVNYEGMIHCVTVADNHTVLAGRNGKFNWCGQSFYGLLGFSLAVFNDFGEADRVTQTGQKLLRRMIGAIQEKGGRVVEADTDGVLFVPPEDARGEDAEIAFTQALTDDLPEGIRVGFDGRYRKMLSYKKKNYALLGYDDALKFKGSSLISRSNEAFGRRFTRRAVRLLLDEDVAGLHDLYMETRARIERHDWPEGARDFCRTESLKDTVEQYEQDVQNGKRPRAASYELAKRHAKRTGQPARKGDRISYYLTGQSANVTAFRNCKRAAEWDPADPDENTAYYLKRLDEFARKFEVFFDDADFRLVFSPEDLFGFNADDIEIQQREHEIADAAGEVHEDEVPF